MKWMNASALDAKASDIMNPEVVCIVTGTKLNEAVKKLAGKGIGGLPVVDEDGRIIGMVTETDLMNFASKIHVVSLMDSSGWISPYTDVAEMVSYQQGYELLEKTTVDSIMSRRVVCVSLDTAAPEVAQLMKKKKINRVPVVDNEGKIHGIIARADLIDFLAGFA
jgi:CBS domain-containing protein